MRFSSSHVVRACLNCAVVGWLGVMPQSLSFVLSSAVAFRSLNSAETSRVLILDTSTMGRRSRLLDMRTTISGATLSVSATRSMTSDMTARLSRENSRRCWFGSITCTSIIVVRMWQKFKTMILFRVYIFIRKFRVWSQNSNGGREERRNNGRSFHSKRRANVLKKMANEWI